MDLLAALDFSFLCSSLGMLHTPTRNEAKICYVHWHGLTVLCDLSEHDPYKSVSKNGIVIISVLL